MGLNKSSGSISEDLDRNFQLLLGRVVAQLRDGGVVGVQRRPRPRQRKQQQSGQGNEQAHSRI